ncbi:MAG: type II secretion system minor pseudopilin GspK [Gammaproteobacteria bacterium]|nr:type II secretion system minor pseudopilin GspK [Gammaproteobacteria bacterium]
MNGYLGSVNAQRGVALVMVLLALALGASLAAGMLARQSLQIYKSSQYLNQRQAQAFALGAESFARQILYRDWEDDKKNNAFVDDAGEVWSQYSAAFPVQFGAIELQIDDLQARLNLNDLVGQDGKVVPRVRSQLERLLQRLEITSIQVDRIVDWIDPDEETGGAYGAEDGIYLSRTPAFRTANRLMGSISELRLIEGVTDEDYRRLLPYVTVLPVRGAGLNINQIDVELIRSLDERITQAQADAILSYRTDTPFANVQDFIARPEFTGMEMKADGLTVQTFFFEVKAQVVFDNQPYALVSVLYRDAEGRFALVSRDESQTRLITKERVVAQ